MGIKLIAVFSWLCVFSAKASSQTFEQEINQAGEQAVSAAKSFRQPGSGQSMPDANHTAFPNANDAFDPAKMGISATFVAIAPGEFTMGSEPYNRNPWWETPHHVTLTKPFELQATEVTQLQYFLVTASAPSNFNDQKDCDQAEFRRMFGFGLCANHPVENASWEDANKFIAKINRVQNRCVYRLPTEAEWEYATRGGMPSNFPYFFGSNDNNDLDHYAWHTGNSDGRTHSVATKKANPFGLYDVYGNVEELVQDYYQTRLPATPAVDPSGPPSGSYHVYRGGSWHETLGNAVINSYKRYRSSSRSGARPGLESNKIGFRLARSCR